MTSPGPRMRRAIVLAGVAAAYFGVAKLGLSFSAHKAIVSAVWPPSGLALAAAFVFGPRVAPAVLVGAFAADATSGTAVLASLGIAAGNAISSTAGGLLLRRAGLDMGLRRVRDVVVLAVLGAGLSTAIKRDHRDGHPVGRAHQQPRRPVGSVARLVARRPHRSADRGAGRPARRRWAAALRADRPCRAGEASVLLAALVAITLLVMRSEITLAFPVFPLIVLAALRFGQVGAVTSAFVVSALGVIFTARGQGPFVETSASADLLRAQVFVGLAAATGLLVAGMRSEWARAEDAVTRLTASENALAEAQRVARIGSWEWDAITGLATFSDEMYRILGLRPGEVEASYDVYLERAHDEDRDEVDAAVLAALDARSSFSFEHRVRTGDLVRWVHNRGRVEVAADGTPRRAVGTVQDVTERRDAEERLAHQALHDPLTGLPNRALFVERLEDALGRAQANRVGLAVFFCDIDSFKGVNDTLGHETGDALLVAMAPRIRLALRPGDLVSRFGGDEFLVLCEQLTTPDRAADVAARLSDAFKEPFSLGGREHHVTASVGAVFAGGRCDHHGRRAPTRRRRGDVPRQGARPRPLRDVRREHASPARRTRRDRVGPPARPHRRRAAPPLPAGGIGRRRRPRGRRGAGALAAPSARADRARGLHGRRRGDGARGAVGRLGHRAGGPPGGGLGDAAGRHQPLAPPGDRGPTSPPCSPARWRRTAWIPPCSSSRSPRRSCSAAATAPRRRCRASRRWACA